MLVDTKPRKIAIYHLLQIVTKDHNLQPTALNGVRLCTSLAWQVNLPLAVKMRTLLC